MADSYKTVYMGGEEEIVEKKSRFIAVLEHVESEDEALAFIEAVKKRHWSARHNCFAYSIGNGANPLLRCSDDGEPQGTAGRPMLEVLCGAELCNTVVVVTRYFGGTLLGTGGLVRAYSQATRAGIEGSMVIERKRAIRMRLESDYGRIGKLQYLAASGGYKILASDYGENVQMTLLVPFAEVDRFEKAVIEATGGQVEPERLEELYYAEADGECLLFDH